MKWSKSRAIQPPMASKTCRVLKRSETEGSDMTLGLQGIRSQGSACLTDMPQLSAPLPPPVRALRCRHEKRSDAQEAMLEKTAKRCKNRLGQRRHRVLASSAGMSLASSG